ncbi:MAG TPA: hypothetical protein VGD21_11090 [Lysobacter sp.]
MRGRLALAEPECRWIFRRLKCKDTGQMAGSDGFTTRGHAFRRYFTPAIIAGVILGFVAAASLIAHSDPDRGMSRAPAAWAIVLFAALLSVFTIPFCRWIGSRGGAQSVRSWVLQGVAFALCGFALTYAAPIPVAPMSMFDLTLEPLGSGSPDAHGSEVWFRVDIDGKAAPFSSIQHGEGWRMRDGWLVAGGPTAPAHFRGRAEAEAKVVFISHDWSGRVKLTANGRTQEINLYSPVAREPVRVEAFDNLKDQLSIFFPERTPAQRVVQCVDAMLIGALLWGLFVAFTTARTANAAPAARRVLPDTLAFALPSLSISLYLLLIFSPALMSSDSVDQWTQATNGRYHDWHPAFHSMAIHLLRLVWDSPAWIGLVQATLLALATGWLISSVRKATSASRIAAWIAAWSCALMPVIAFMSITLWKDIPYTAGVVAITAACVNILILKNIRLHKPAVFAAVWFVIVACMLLRHNGPPVAIATIVVLAVLVKQQRKVLAVLGLSAIVAFALMKGPVQDLAGVTKTNVSYTLYAHHIAAHLRYGHLPKDPADVALLRQIGGTDGEWPYLCSSVNPVIFDAKFKGQIAGQHKVDLLRIWLELAARHPGIEVQHASCVGGLVWRITNNAPQDPLYHYTLAFSNRDGEVRWVDANTAGVHETTRFREQAQQLGGWVMSLDYDLLWRPAFYLYLFLFAVAVAVRRMREWRIAIVALPLVAHSGVLLLANVAQDVRYQLAAFVIALATVPLLLRSSPPSASDEGTGQP